MVSYQGNLTHGPTVWKQRLIHLKKINVIFRVTTVEIQS